MVDLPILFISPHEPQYTPKFIIPAADILDFSLVKRRF
jgi:hypothetical protein